MNCKLAEELYETALELCQKLGLSRSLVECVHQYLIYLGWEYSLNTSFQIAQKAQSMMKMQDWGLSSSQWEQMESVVWSFGF